MVIRLSFRLRRRRYYYRLVRYGLTIIFAGDICAFSTIFRPTDRVLVGRLARRGGARQTALPAVSVVGGGGSGTTRGKKRQSTSSCVPRRPFFSRRGVRVVVRFRGRTKRPGKKRTASDRGKRRVHAAGSKLFPVRTAPPDGTTFAQVTVGDKAEGELPAFGYWNVQFYHPRAAYVRFDYEFPRGASIAVYGRRNALPTHTQYEILELLNGFESPRRARSTHVSQPSRLD